MNIAVCVNHVPDTAAKIKIGGDGKTIDPAGVSYVINPYDEFAIEEALRTKEKFGGVVYAISVGADSNQETIRKALAMGCDEGIHVKTDGEIDGMSVARELAKQIRHLECALVFMGKQSIDYDEGIVGQLTAEMLGYHCVSVCVRFELQGGKIAAEREIEGGREIVETSLPVLITAQKGLNEPRYASLKGIMAAKKKTINVVQPDSPLAEPVVHGMKKPAEKSAGKIAGTDASAAAELVRLLHEEAKVI